MSLPPSNFSSASNVVHAYFLTLLLVILGAGLWSRHAIVSNLVGQAQHTNVHIAERLFSAYQAKQSRISIPAVEARIYSSSGRLFYSHSGINAEIHTDMLVQAIRGQAVSKYMAKGINPESGNVEPVLLSYIPVLRDDDVLSGIVEVYADAKSLRASINQVDQQFSLAMLLVGIVTVLGLYFISRNIQSYIRQQQQAIEHQINHDDLTGLANRILFWDHLKLAISHARRDESLVAVMRLNLDRFKQVNDALGHALADQLLMELATRLKKTVRACDTVARIGGDDFAIIISELKRKDEVENVVHRILEPLHRKYVIESHEIDVGISIGLAVYPVDQSDAEKLLSFADAALRESKGAGGDQYVFFTPDMARESGNRLHEEQGLRRALENNELCLHYQPKVDSTTGSIKGFEALMRWQHPERGLVPPLEFIPVMEESGLILPAGEWVIKETCETIKRWMEQGLPAMPVSVNVSAPQFKQTNFVQRVQNILDETGVDPQYLEIELTESCLMSDGERNQNILQTLKEMGVSISVDDFGTGYSSLSHLKRFPIDTVKIDRSFITNVHKRRENDNAGIVTAIMALSHSLRLNVVAEGVETAQELAYLHALGCRTIQGFLFSRPLTESDVIGLLQDSQSMKEIMESVRAELQL